MADQLDRVKAKLTTLGQRDTTHYVFGSQSHCYRLNCCLTEERLQEIEHAHQITLPADYRRFLLEIGNGGAGPGYGLLTLEQSLRGVLPGFLRQPFPYTQLCNTARDPAPEDPLDAEMESAVQRAIAEDPHVELRLDFGCLWIIHQGCGIYNHLVVSGPERGHIWVSDPNGQGLIYYPISGYSRTSVDACTLGPERTTFLDWYEGWLDASLAEVAATGT